MAKFKNKVAKKKNSKMDTKKNAQIFVLKDKMQSLLVGKKYVEAMDVMAEIAQMGSMDAEVMCWGAQCYYATGDYERATKWVNNTLSADNGNMQARVILGQLCARDNRQADALKIYEFVLANGADKLTDTDKEILEESLYMYKYSYQAEIEDYPHIQAFLKTPVHVDDNIAHTQIACSEKNDEIVPVIKSDIVEDNNDIIAKLRALLAKETEEKEAVQIDNIQNAEEPQALCVNTFINEKDSKENTEVSDIIKQVEEKNCGLVQKIDILTAFAGGYYQDNAYDAAYALLSAALKLDEANENVLRSLAYTCLSMSKVETAMEYAAQLPVTDFGLLYAMKQK